ncbi:MAG TPA: bifunctional phosphopantothenoylcysteine decarboxylase/phosphopantothenate--cysteine ligase CoaBC [Acidobacteriaceae bacterium]|nr:bifunctional phosphopantothenoylcysteine decarboxylase/phosphopantothenate--cysteine ligase CoaBC [Acidobacteriaceae bacterium]
MKILLGVCGGIAAYKSAELVRELQRGGAEVQVVMTANAERFITPLTLAGLSGSQVLTSLWEPSASETTTNEPQRFEMEHIRLAQEADAILIAPATATLLAKLAHGIADDLLTTICLASQSPLLIAPAMNVNMWQHPATKGNIATLRARGAVVIEPAHGALACGMVGEGRLASVEQIVESVLRVTRRARDLTGETVLITAGGTREPIDPVRFLGNRSSGKMGVAIAEAAVARGAEVILISAARPLAELPCRQIDVTTAEEMLNAVLEELPRASMVFMAAAVADYRVAEPAIYKRKKAATLTLELVQNEDILMHVVRERRHGTLVVGFAAETHNLLEEARRKLRSKGADAIVANDVSRTDAGFEGDDNEGFLLTRERQIPLPLSTKRAMADLLFDELIPFAERLRCESDAVVAMEVNGAIYSNG